MRIIYGEIEPGIRIGKYLLGSTKEEILPRLEDYKVWERGDGFCIYSFDNFENFESAAHVVYPLYSDRNSLYKDKKNNRYYLVIEKITCTSSDFNKTCNILSEYGNKENMPASSLTFFDEHYECIIKKHAIQTIVKI